MSGRRILVTGFKMAGVPALLALAAPAQACLMEPLPEAVLLDVPPRDPPPGYVVMRVVAAPVSGDRGKLQVRFVDPAVRKRLGVSGWLEPEQATSCTDWGRLGSRAFVVARATGRLGGRTLLRARVYPRSRWDRWWSFFGIARYTPS